MRRRQDHLIRNLLIASLIAIAAMHPAAVGHMAQLGVTLVLAIVQGAAEAAADQPGPAAILATAIYAAHQIRTRPHTRTH